jgi:hypothetical protein
MKTGALFSGRRRCCPKIVAPALCLPTPAATDAERASESREESEQDQSTQKE